MLNGDNMSWKQEHDEVVCQYDYQYSMIQAQKPADVWAARQGERDVQWKHHRQDAIKASQVTSFCIVSLSASQSVRAREKGKQYRMMILVVIVQDRMQRRIS